jgi:hypothetical protein
MDPIWRLLTRGKYPPYLLWCTEAETIDVASGCRGNGDGLALEKALMNRRINPAPFRSAACVVQKSETITQEVSLPMVLFFVLTLETCGFNLGYIFRAGAVQSTT